MRRLPKPASLPPPGRRIAWLLEGIAEEENYTYSTYSDNWLIRLDNPETGAVFHAVGYKLGNKAAPSYICDDKPLLSSLLKEKGLPCIDHQFFISPNLKQWAKETGSLSSLKEWAAAFNYDVVLKPHQGTGGRGVVRCRSVVDIEDAAITLFGEGYGIAACPYYPILAEYRVVMHRDIIEHSIVYEKKRPLLIGDGVSSVGQLLSSGAYTGVRNLKLPISGIERNYALHEAPAQGEVLPLVWKHNLSGGAKAELIVEQALRTTLLELALRATAVIDLDFSSVDIVALVDPIQEAKYLVLEINSGVMLERLMEDIPNGISLAKELYRYVVKKSLEQ